VTVEKINGAYQVILNGEQIPASSHQQHLQRHHGTGWQRKRSEGLHSRQDPERKILIKSIHQRQQTISNIAHEIVETQRDFFDKGSAFLKPMTMVQIADAVGVHETTVESRHFRQIHVHAAGRVRDEIFFHSGYQTATGESMSNTSVKEAILDLVQE